MITPVFREEFFLDAIINGTTPPDPVFRVEYFLAKIAGADVETPTPIFRIEKYLAKIGGEDVEIPDPVFREEYWLAKKCGENVTTPTPVFRLEYFLEEWVNGSAPAYQSVTGKIVSFLTQRIAPLKIEATLTPIQSGTGDPSPENIRPISGHTGADVYVEDEYDALATPTAEITFGQTVYGGTLTVNEDGTGSVVASDALVNMTVSESSITIGTSSLGVKYADIPYTSLGIPSINNQEVVTSEYKWVDQSTTGANGLIKTFSYAITVFDNRFTDKATAKSILDTVQLLYPLATPITIPLTSGIVEALQGQNVVWVDDSGEIKVTYRSN